MWDKYTNSYNACFSTSGQIVQVQVFVVFMSMNHSIHCHHLQRVAIINLMYLVCIAAVHRSQR